MNVSICHTSKKSTIRDVSYVLTLFSALALDNVLHFFVCLGLPAKIVLIKPIIQGASYVFMTLCVVMNKKISVQWILFNMVYIVLLLLGAIFHSKTWIYTQELLKYYIISIFPITLCLATISDVDRLMKVFRIVSYASLVYIFVYPFFPEQAFSSGMGMAYGSIVCWAVIMHFAFSERKIIDIIISVYCAAILIVFGTRGVLLCIAGFLIYQAVSIGSRRRRIVTIAIVAIAAIILVMNYYVLLEGLSGLLQKLNLPSSVLRKVTRYGIMYDNGRAVLWNKMIDSINILGNGIGYDRVIGGGSGLYAHNLFIELMVDFGLIFGPLAIIGLMYIYGKMLFGRTVQAPHRDVFSVLAIPGFFMLMVSGSVYSTYMIFSAITIWIVWRRDANKCRNYDIKAENKHENTSLGV